MPSPRATTKMRRRDFDERHAEALMGGHDYEFIFLGENEKTPTDYHDSPRIDERRRVAWEVLRDSIMADWIQERPFTRPYAWWCFESKERRRCINRQHPHDNPERIADVAKTEAEYPGFAYRAMRLIRGKPNILFGADFKLDPKPEYETEREYLIRLDLLTRYEHELLAGEKP